MTTKHAKGPWRVEKSKNPHHSFEVFAADGYHVARFEVDGIETEEANARLIAAAPDLLSALEDLVRKQIIFDPKGNSEAFARAKEAIQKATNP